MKSITFFVPGRPRGKGRPRFTKRGQAYTPKATRAYEQKIRAAYMEQCGESFGSLPVSVRIEALFPIPKGWSKSRRAEAEGSPVLTKPDADNVCKAVLDALNGVAFTDDAQVVRLVITKKYSTGEGSIEVTVSDATP